MSKFFRWRRAASKAVAMESGVGGDLGPPHELNGSVGLDDSGCLNHVGEGASSGPGVGTAADEHVARFWVETLGLDPHPFMSNGFFQETFRDDEAVVSVAPVDEGDDGDHQQQQHQDGPLLRRCVSTLMYFLHLPEEPLCASTLFFRSRTSAVMMHYYKGLSVSVYYLEDDQQQTGHNSEVASTRDEDGISVVDDDHENDGDVEDEDSGSVNSRSSGKISRKSATSQRRRVLHKVTLGQGGPKANETFQVVVSRGTWFARILEEEPDSKVWTVDEYLDGDRFSLVGVTVAPGFDYSDLATASFESVEYFK